MYVYVYIVPPSLSIGRQNMIIHENTEAKMCFINFSLSQLPEQGGNYDSRFDVDKGTGTIIVARPLDAEQKSNYNLTVEATDGTRSISTQVRNILMKHL